MAKRKTTAKSKAPKTTEVQTRPSEAKTSGSLFSRLTSNKFALAGVILAIILALYMGRSLFLAASVNGEPIYRLSVISQLEKQNGAAVLDALINEAIIKQELKKQNVQISKEEISAEIKKIEGLLAAQQQNLDEVLKQRGMTRKDLEDQIILNKGVEKLLGKEVAITDSEVQAYIEQNRQYMPEATDSAALEKQAREQLSQQKVAEKYQAWLENAKKKAKVTNFVGY